ncbi:MAG: site-2 protease family protein [Chloroflexi bacterium]|nr:site-2 protease family protein [Chloroflexota bacterium]
MFDTTRIVETIIILLVSITWHELAHALTAQYLGDDTPRLTGHLSLNPFRHMDQFGAILLFLSAIAGFGFAYGFTPVTERNLRPNAKAGGGIVAIVGPISNIILAALIAIPLRFSLFDFNAQQGLFDFLQHALLLNIFLAVFNIIPLPPLDGWRVLQTFLSPRQLYELRGVQQYGPLVLFVIFIFGNQLGFYNVLYNDFIYPIASVLLGPQFSVG